MQMARLCNSDKLRKLKISTLFFPTGAFHSKMCAQASLHDLAWHNEKRNYPIYMLKWQEIAKKYETGIIRLIFWVNKKRMEYSSPVIGFMDEMCRKKAESSTKVKHNLSDLVLDISHDFWGNIREGLQNSGRIFTDRRRLVISLNIIHFLMFYIILWKM